MCSSFSSPPTLALPSSSRACRLLLRHHLNLLHLHPTFCQARRLTHYHNPLVCASTHCRYHLNLMHLHPPPVKRIASRTTIIPLVCASTHYDHHHNHMHLHPPPFRRSDSCKYILLSCVSPLVMGTHQNLPHLHPSRDLSLHSTIVHRPPSLPSEKPWPSDSPRKREPTIERHRALELFQSVGSGLWPVLLLTSVYFPASNHDAAAKLHVQQFKIVIAELVG